MSVELGRDCARSAERERERERERDYDHGPGQYHTSVSLSLSHHYDNHLHHTLLSKGNKQTVTTPARALFYLYGLALYL